MWHKPSCISGRIEEDYAVTDAYLADLDPGTLIDTQISEAADCGELIAANFEPSSVRQACYELRASDIFYDLALPEPERRRVVASDEKGFLLGPRRYVVAIVAEEIALPPDMMARILAKGQFMSLGLLPVNTYADPGFSGRLGVVLFNASNRYVWVSPRQAIAKIEFVKLERAVAHPYSGQHGYETSIWPYPFHLYARDSELRSLGIRPEAADQLRLSHGDGIARLARKVSYYERQVWIQIAIVLALFSVLFALNDRMSLLLSAGIGVGVNLLTQFGFFWWTDRRTRSTMNYVN
jgi:dCTP deaminase